MKNHTETRLLHLLRACTFVLMMVAAVLLIIET